MKKLFVVMFAILMFASCKSTESESGTKDVEVKKDNLESEYLGTVGAKNRGSFQVFRFKIDNVTYIVGSEYNGGMTLIDKIENKF